METASRTRLLQATFEQHPKHIPGTAIASLVASKAA